MAIEVFNRYEHKYIIDENTFCKVLKIINEHMITEFCCLRRSEGIILQKRLFCLLTVL